MLFPVIKVIDRQCKDATPHIVGTNSHDTLYVDDKSGGIQYHNLQNGESTRRFEDRGEHAYDFDAPREVDEYGPGDMQIEFLTIEDLVELCIEQTRASCDRERQLRDMLRRIEEVRETAIKANGLDDDRFASSAGVLY